MFAFHIAYTLGLITLTGGVALFIWALRNKGTGVMLAKVLGAIIAILAIISIVCSVFDDLNLIKMQRMLQARMIQLQTIKMPNQPQKQTKPMRVTKPAAANKANNNQSASNAHARSANHAQTSRAQNRTASSKASNAQANTASTAAQPIS